MDLATTLLQLPAVTPPDNPWQFIIFVVVTILSNYIITLIQKSSEKKKEAKADQDKVKNMDVNLRHNNEVQRHIKDILIQIQGYTEASRVSLYNSHNGVQTHYEYCMHFVSMVEEKTDGIVAPLIDTFQRVPAALFRPIIDKVDDSESGHTKISKEDLNPEDRIIFDKYQNSICYYFKVGNSVWEGVVELAWVNKKMILSDTEIDHVHDLVTIISDLQRKLVKL